MASHATVPGVDTPIALITLRKYNVLVILPIGSGCRARAQTSYASNTRGPDSGRDRLYKIDDVPYVFVLEMVSKSWHGGVFDAPLNEREKYTVCMERDVKS